MENRKIQNATPKEYNGIQFKSLAEVNTYKWLSQQGFNPEYEKHKFVLWDTYVSTVPFYTRNSFNRKNKHIEVLSAKTVKDMRPLTPITYTPDIVFEYKGKCIIVEVKGFTNDLFPYKFKMFRKYLSELPDSQRYELWEIFSQTQLKELTTRLINDCKEL